MTPDINWKNIDIDHVKPITSFDISDDEQLKEVFNWRKKYPTFIKSFINKSVIKINFQNINYNSLRHINFSN